MSLQSSKIGVELSLLASPYMKNKIKRECQWEKPAEEWVKINTDGSACKKGFGCGFLIRNCKGEPLGGKSTRIDGHDSLETELVAIFLACTRAERLGLKNVWIESDCLIGVRLVNRKSGGPWEHCDILRNIRNKLSMFEKWAVTHVWREANRGADKLARMGALGRVISFDEKSIPEFIHKYVLDDLTCSYTRLVKA